MSDRTIDDGDARSGRASEPPRRSSPSSPGGIEPIRISAPPPDFDDGPGGETKQTPKDELARWRRMASRAAADRSRTGMLGPLDGDGTLDERDLITAQSLPAEEEPTVQSPPRSFDPEPVSHTEATRHVPNPLAPGPDRPSTPMPWSPQRISEPPTSRVEPPTRELSLSSDVIALSRRDVTGSIVTHSIPPRAPPPRPALRPAASMSVPPEIPFVPSAAPIGVSIPPQLLSMPAKESGPASRTAALVAMGVIALALVGATALVLWPSVDPMVAPPTAVAPTPVVTAPVVPVPAVPPIAPVAPTPAFAAAPPTIAMPTPAPVAPTPVAPTVAPPTPAPPTPATNVVATPAPPTPIAPPAGAADDPASVDALIAEGDAALEADRPSEALSVYQRAIALDSHAAYAFAGAARACLALSRGPDAVRFAERAVAHRQRRASFRVLLGDAHEAAGSPSEARAAWERALELDPEDRVAAARLGR